MSAKDASLLGYSEGSQIGAYTLIEPIGQGGMGSVWRARRADGLMEREVAIKLIALGMRTMTTRERFARERQILASLDHPNIARLFDAGVSGGGQPYLVLELVQGERIDTFADENTLSVAARVRLFLQVLAAVGHAHQHLIIHRDIKPGNILVNALGEVKLLDFGVSKLLDEADGSAATSELTREGGRLMTPEYAAPEQLKNHPVTTSTDVYALGVLLYQLLTGCLPHGQGTDSPIEVAQSIVENEPVRASELATRAVVLSPNRAAAAACASSRAHIPLTLTEAVTDAEIEAAAITQPVTLSAQTRADRRGTTTRKLSASLSGDLDNILAKALKKDPYERYATVAEFADDLRAYLELRPVRAQPDSMGYRTRKFMQRNRGMVATAGFTVFAILAGVATTTWQAMEARKQASIAKLEAQKANAIRDYVVNMFRAVGRDARDFPKRGNTTARELIDQASTRLNGEFASQPEIKAFIRETISGIYFDLDQTPKALSEAQQWLNDAERSLGPTHPQTVAALIQNASVLGRMSRDKQAAEMLQRAEAALGSLPKGEQWVKFLMAQAALDSLNYRTKEAAARFAQIEPQIAKYPHLIPDFDFLQGQASFQTGQFRIGVERLKAAAQGYAAQEGEGSAKVADANWRLGILQLYRNDWGQAEKTLQQAYDIVQAQSEAGHRDTLVVRRDLAFAKSRVGKRDEAFKIVDGVLVDARKRAALDQNTPFLSGALQTWGRIHMFAGDIEAAHDAFTQANALMVQSTQSELFKAISRFDLALTTAARGDPAASVPIAKGVIEAYMKQASGVDTPITITAKMQLAEAIRNADPALAQTWLAAVKAFDWSEFAFPSTLVRAHLVSAQIAGERNELELAKREIESARSILTRHSESPEHAFRLAQADVLAASIFGAKHAVGAQACAQVVLATKTIARYSVPQSPQLTLAKRAQDSCTPV